MKINSKIRGLVWLILAMVGIIFVASNSYTTEDSVVDWQEYFSSMSEDEAGLEYLEILSYKYEKDPVISVSSSDYTFDIHRMVEEEFNYESNFYIVGKDIKLDEDGTPELGLIDVLLYCSTENNLYGKLVGEMSRLSWLSGTKVLVGTIELDSCDGDNYSLIIDGSKVEEIYGTSEIEIIHLEDHYNVDDYLIAEQVESKLNLEDGFQNDYNKAGFVQYNWEKAVINGLIAAVIIIPIALGLFYATEKELFGVNILKKGNKK